MPAPETDLVTSTAALAREPDIMENALEGSTVINSPDEQDEIALLAYQYYEERGGQNGSPEGDWYRAEAEVRRRRSERPERTIAGAAA